MSTVEHENEGELDEDQRSAAAEADQEEVEDGPIEVAYTDLAEIGAEGTEGYA